MDGQVRFILNSTPDTLNRNPLSVELPLRVLKLLLNPLEVILRLHKRTEERSKRAKCSRPGYQVAGINVRVDTLFMALLWVVLFPGRKLTVPLLS